MSIRKASHSGSWYSDNSQELNGQLTNWLNSAKYLHGPAKAIISPHAGHLISKTVFKHQFFILF